MTNPSTKVVIVPRGELIAEKHVDSIDNALLQEVRIRSVLTCETISGVCAKPERASAS